MNNPSATGETGSSMTSHLADMLGWATGKKLLRYLKFVAKKLGKSESMAARK